MPYSVDVDSGRSSCSAGSFAVGAVINNVHVNASDEIKNKLLTSCEGRGNRQLHVSSRPRSCVGLLRSPNERDPFPARVEATRRNTLQSIVDTPRKGGLTNAHSTIDIISSTRIEHAQNTKQTAVSLTNIQDGVVRPQNKRGKPVQRAASRLYSVESLRSDRAVVGPEFIIRASQPVQQLDITNETELLKRSVTVVLLTGQRIVVTVEPNSVTAGHIFEAIVKKEKYDHNFMLGMAVLIGGDFVFLPDEYKIKKVSPEGWHKALKKVKEVRASFSFTMYVRIKFFLPTNISKTIEGGEWRYRVYLQLRKSTLEGQLTTSVQNLIMLAGYALHIEFGDFFYREHGSGDYFLLEHYLPEGSFPSDTAEIKLRMKRAHESRKGMEREKAIINYIMLAQSYRDYGSHFYSSVWATRDGFCRDVWLTIGPRGITLYSRNSCILALPTESQPGNVSNRIVLQCLPWVHIHSMHYNKKTLYIIPNSRAGQTKSSLKYKIKMEDHKSYFTFWLASLHHRLYLKLHSKQDLIDCMSDDFSYPVSPVSSESDRVDCSNYQDSYNIAVRNQHKMKRPIKKKFKMGIFSKSQDKLNKENEKPDTQRLLQELLSSRLDQSNELDCSVTSVTSKPNYSSNEGLSSSESSLPRRQGVKMGTRAFHGAKRIPITSRLDNSMKSDSELMATQSDSDDFSLEPKNVMYKLNGMKLLPHRNYNERDCKNQQSAYIVESPKVCSSFVYHPTENTTPVNNSLIAKLESSTCIQSERCFVTAIVSRDAAGTLGIQVAEGSDGNVYIQSITRNGPAYLVKKLTPGDQIISVNGHTLLNVEYKKALSMLQSAPEKVELIVLQNIKPTSTNEGLHFKPNTVAGKSADLNEISPSDVEYLHMIDRKIINEETLKTIQALINLTKQNLVIRMRDDSNLNTPNKLLMQKCLSENKMYDESDAGNFSSQENTPEKKQDRLYDTCRVRNQTKTKRRPLSLHIPANVELSEKFFRNFETDDSTCDIAVLEKASLNKVQSSLQNLREKLMNEPDMKNVAVPRAFGLSRKWLGPVKYPVTPVKESNDITVKSKEQIIKKHFIYGGGNSVDDQLFL